jgi:hypothetical protein
MCDIGKPVEVIDVEPLSLPAHRARGRGVPSSSGMAICSSWIAL